MDPESKKIVSIFNPRLDAWSDHFLWRGVEVVGLTSTGRATIVRLQMNRPIVLAVREEEKHRHRHPPVRTV
jgi:hypothetical protein